jgi:hypothetical protein
MSFVSLLSLSGWVILFALYEDLGGFILIKYCFDDDSNLVVNCVAYFLVGETGSLIG